MKVLNIKTTGVISFVLDDLEIVTDVTDSDFEQSIQQQFYDLIVELQEANFQEIHFENSNLQTFTHKVGIGSFESSDRADHIIFMSMDTWADAFRNG